MEYQEKDQTVYFKVQEILDEFIPIKEKFKRFEDEKLGEDTVTTSDVQQEKVISPKKFVSRHSSFCNIDDSEPHLKNRLMNVSIQQEKGLKIKYVGKESKYETIIGCQRIRDEHVTFEVLRVTGEIYFGVVQCSSKGSFKMTQAHYVGQTADSWSFNSKGYKFHDGLGLEYGSDVY